MVWEFGQTCEAAGNGKREQIEKLLVKKRLSIFSLKSSYGNDFRKKIGTNQ